MTSQFDEKAVFDIARQIDAEAVRIDYLKQVCGDDQRMFDRVSALIQIRSQQPGFLEKPAAAIAPTLAGAVSERPGTQIGPYKLHQEIGEGGMGVVYMALQKEPVRRKVALKIIKPGMDTREVIARFAAEEQALAMMDHPNIARVFDAGTTESGRPYFVMELVNGVPITQYCDDNNATTGQRLELFTLVCHAVQHAHQKGIIHRDLKPSNILVTLHDGVPVPKIIDFGIAKAINQELTSQTMATGLGHMLGTPLYMSPEQAERSGLDIDTRSDIYSLGVLLYELLTGSTPFERGTLKDLGLDELRRVIREQEPPRPSTRISTMGMAATTVSEHRRTTPVELSNSLRHELDWIVMKALEKDRTRRYESATDFARDIQRYLHDEAVEACPPSTAYRLKKFMRRNRTAVLSIAAIGLALILGAGVATGQAYRATKAEKYAEEQLQIAQEQKRLAREQEALAKKQKKLAEESAQRERNLRTEAEAARKQSEAVTNFLVDIFRSPDPERDGRTITVAEMLDKAKSRVETEFQEDKVLQAKLLGAIGETYAGLGLVQLASEVATQTFDLLHNALGPRHLDTLAAQQDMADALSSAGRESDAIKLGEETLQIRREVLGETHPDTLTSVVHLAQSYLTMGNSQKAIDLLEPNLPVIKRVLGLDHLKTQAAMGALEGAYREAGQPDKLLALTEDTLNARKETLGREHPSTLTVMNSLACQYWRLNRLDQSIPLFEETLALRRSILGPVHPDTLETVSSLSCNYLSANQPEKAVPLLEDALQQCKQKLGPGHPTTLNCMNNLVGAYHGVGRFDDALRMLEECCRLAKENLGPTHPQTLIVMANLGRWYWQQKKFDQSIPLFEDAVRGARETRGENHATTLEFMGSLGQNFTDAGRFDEAITLLEKTLAISKEQLGPEHATTLGTMNNLAVAYGKSDRVASAVPLMRQAVDTWRRTLGLEHAQTIAGTVSLAAMHMRQGEYDAAEPLLLSIYEVLAKQVDSGFSPAGAQKLQVVTEKLVQLYEKSNQPDKAKEWQEKLDALKVEIENRK